MLQFDLRVNDGVPTGTLISNQAVVETVELPDLLTDGDGNPATGPEPTVVVVGSGQQLSITKQVAVVGGGPAVPGAELEYVVTVTNIAAVPALYVVITDDLDASQTGYLAYVDQSATMNGSTTGVSFAGTTITADYGAANGNLEPGATVVLRFRATIAPGLAIGTRITNTGVVTWNNPPQTASASVSIDVGGMPGVGVLNGTAWHDADFDDALDTAERPLEGWTVELYRDGELVFSTRDRRGRRVPDQRPAAELPSAARCTSCASARRARAPRPRRSVARTPTSRTTCSGSRTSSCSRAPICRT